MLQWVPPYLGQPRRVSGQSGWHPLMMLTRDHIYIIKFVHENICRFITSRDSDGLLYSFKMLLGQWFCGKFVTLIGYFLSRRITDYWKFRNLKKKKRNIPIVFHAHAGSHQRNSVPCQRHVALLLPRRLDTLASSETGGAASTVERAWRNRHATALQLVTDQTTTTRLTSNTTCIYRHLT